MTISQHGLIVGFAGRVRLQDDAFLLLQARKLGLGAKNAWPGAVRQDLMRHLHWTLTSDDPERSWKPQAMLALLRQLIGCGRM